MAASIIFLMEIEQQILREVRQFARDYTANKWSIKMWKQVVLLIPMFLRTAGSYTIYEDILSTIFFLWVKDLFTYFKINDRLFFQTYLNLHCIFQRRKLRPREVRCQQHVWAPTPLPVQGPHSEGAQRQMSRFWVIDNLLSAQRLKKPSFFVFSGTWRNLFYCLRRWWGKWIYSPDKTLGFNSFLDDTEFQKQDLFPLVLVC